MSEIQPGNLCCYARITKKEFLVFCDYCVYTHLERWVKKTTAQLLDSLSEHKILAIWGFTWLLNPSWVERGLLWIDDDSNYLRKVIDPYRQMRSEVHIRGPLEIMEDSREPSWHLMFCGKFGVCTDGLKDIGFRGQYSSSMTSSWRSIDIHRDFWLCLAR